MREATVVGFVGSAAGILAFLGDAGGNLCCERLGREETLAGAFAGPEHGCYGASSGSTHHPHCH